MQIGRRVKEIVSKLPPECPRCSGTMGGMEHCDMCHGVRELRAVLGIKEPDTLSGSYNLNGKWIRRTQG
jgi:hypothetical protein